MPVHLAVHFEGGNVLYCNGTTFGQALASVLDICDNDPLREIQHYLNRITGIEQVDEQAEVIARIPDTTLPTDEEIEKMILELAGDKCDYISVGRVQSNKPTKVITFWIREFEVGFEQANQVGWELVKRFPALDLYGFHVCAHQGRDPREVESGRFIYPKDE